MTMYNFWRFSRKIKLIIQKIYSVNMDFHLICLLIRSCTIRVQRHNKHPKNSRFMLFHKMSSVHRNRVKSMINISSCLNLATYKDSDTNKCRVPTSEIKSQHSRLSCPAKINPCCQVLCLFFIQIKHLSFNLLVCLECRQCYQPN